MKFIDLAPIGNPSLLDDSAIASDTKGQIEVLLHENNRRPRFSDDLDKDFSDLLNDIRLDTLRRFVQQYDLRLSAHRARYGELLLLSA